MSRSLVGHISKRSLHTILGGLLVLVVLFFAITRTQVGRDTLARQLESQFASATNGTLSIGLLTGNVRQDLFAADVSIRDAQGRVAVQIDSVIIRPRWSSLLRKEFSIHEVTLLRPRVDMTALLEDPSSWATSSDAESDSISAASAGNPWTFKNASFRVEEGALIGIPDMRSVELSSVENIHLRAIASWGTEDGQVDVIGLRASLPDQDLTIREASSQFVFRPDRWFLNQLVVETGASTLRLRGAVDPLHSDANWLNRFFQLEVEPSEIDFDELRRVFPALPLSGGARVAAYVSGPLSDMTVPWIRLERGNTRLAFEGTAYGFPDSLSLELSMADGQLFPEDLQAWLPENRRIRDVRAAISDLQFYTSGVMQLTADEPLSTLPEAVKLRSSFDMRSSGGLVSGTLQLDGSVRDSLAHQVTIRLEEVNGYSWTSRARWRSSVSGFTSLSGSSSWSGSVDGKPASRLQFLTRARGQFADVRFGERQADSLRFDLTGSTEGLGGDLLIRDADGMLNNTLNLSRTADGILQLETQTIASNFDVGRLSGRSRIQSAINARLDGVTRLNWDRAFEASLTAQVDSSELRINDRLASVPPHALTLQVRPPESSEPVLTLVSDMADLTIESDISVPTMVSLSRAWMSAVNAAIDEEGRKLLNRTVDDALDPERQLDQLLTAEAALNRFPAGMSSARSSVALSLHSGSMASALSPSFPRLEGAGTLSMDVVWAADSLMTTSVLQSEQFRFNGIGMTAPRMELETTLSRGASVLATLRSDMIATSDSLTIGGTSLSSNRITWNVADGRGTASAVSAGTNRVSSMGLQAEWTRRDSFNEIQLTDLLLDTGNGAWSIEQPATFGLYGNASTLDGLDIVFRRDGRATGQTIFAGGVFSAAPQDSMLVAFEDLELRPLSEFMEWRRVLGGLVNAELIVRGGYSQPRVAGGIRVDTLSLDHNILGNMSLSSDYVAARPEVAVRLDLNPIAPDDRAVLFGTDLPARIIQNELSIAGDIRLPGRSDDEAGSLNLDAMIDQADLFWLQQYLFPEVLGSVSGFLSGEGRITGDFSYPVFDVRLGIVDGRFSIPYTQTSYSASGALRLDREAIHFEPLRLFDGTGGDLDVTGRLLFNDYTSFTFDMDGRLDEFQIMNVAESDELPFYGFIWASGDIQLTGPLFNARLVSTNGRTTDNSELFIPIEEETTETDLAFIVFEETPGVIPDFQQLESRSSILQRRPTSERQFLDGLNLDLNIDAPPGSIVHLVIDPLLGDVINAVSAGNVQLILENDEFQVFGRLDVTSGDYQFTAGELFIKTFLINPGGFIEWSGDPINATLNIPASYRTRASRAGLPGAEGERPGVIPLIVDLQIGGTVESPQVELSLSIDRSNQNVLGEYQALETLLNQPDRATEYATSVLILNSFQLTTDNITADSGGQLAFNSVSQLVTAQLNRFLESALPNVDFSLGLQGESAQDLDVTYGVALRLLNERLIIRGEGVYQGARSTENIRTSDGLQGEFVVEIRVGPRVSVEVFFRRESDILETTQLTNTAGVGISYQTEFVSWRSIIRADVPQNQ